MTTLLIIGISLNQINVFRFKITLMIIQIIVLLLVVLKHANSVSGRLIIVQAANGMVDIILKALFVFYVMNQSNIAQNA